MPEHLLVTIGKARFSDSERHLIPFVNDIEQDEFLNDIENTPHAFVLACLMDRQVKAERAWSIPFRIKEIIGSFKIDDLASVSLEEYKNIFNRNVLHRFNDTMAEVFYSAVSMAI
jgi:endonuclease-3